MQTLISGVDEATVRGLLGGQDLRDAGLSWTDPAVAVRSLGTGDAPAASKLVWLYRSPMRELMSAAGSDEPGDAAEILGRWCSRNQAVLEFHRRGAGPSMLVNAGRAWRSGWLPGIRGAVAAGDAAAAGAADGGVAGQLEGALQRILEFDFPEAIDLFEALEASSWMPDGESPWFRDSVAATGVDLARITEAFASIPVSLQRKDELEREVARVQQELQREQAELAACMRENELLLLQLRTLQDDARRLASEDRTSALRTRVDELELQVKLLRKPLEQHLALLCTHEGAGLRVRLARRLVPPGSLALARSERRGRIEELRQSAWFDADWYTRTYKDIDWKGIDPAAHYYDWGWLEGRDPGPRFSTRYYLREYPDVAEAGLNPLWHFIRFGEQEGRSPAAASPGSRKP